MIQQIAQEKVDLTEQALQQIDQQVVEEISQKTTEQAVEQLYQQVVEEMSQKQLEKQQASLL
jgi:ribosomal protein S3AE